MLFLLCCELMACGNNWIVPEPPPALAGAVCEKWTYYQSSSTSIVCHLETHTDGGTPDAGMGY